jgi:hypothetical protein
MLTAVEHEILADWIEAETTVAHRLPLATLRVLVDNHESNTLFPLIATQDIQINFKIGEKEENDVFCA